MSNSTLRAVEAFIDSQQLLQPGETHLVGVSGGADSVALLLMLQRLGYRVEAVHCNFKLRGKESDRDEDFVRSLCKNHGIALHITHFDTIEYARLHKVSIEMAARQLRYAYFEQLRRDVGAATICIAHHKDDSVETILINLLRGTGIHGLTGIKARQGNVVRPLLCLSRQEIRAWLAEEQQTFVEDSSNAVPDIVRNKLRLNVIPQLTAISAAATDSILATARRLTETEKVCQEAIKPKIEELKTAGSIAISDLLSQPSPELILYHWLAPMGFTPATIEAISQRLNDVQAGRLWQSPTHQLCVSQERLIAMPRKTEGRPSMVFPEPANYAYDQGRDHFRISRVAGAQVERDSSTACLDAARTAFPLTLRTVRQGDRFQPFGMKGTKLVSDFLTDIKMPLPLRQQQLVLTAADGNIVWLVDHRPDGRYAVGEETQHTLIIRHSSEEKQDIK